MTVGDRIKKLRELFDITSNDFAKLVDIHPVTIRKYETNKMIPSKEHIDKMCAALRLPRMIFEGVPEQYTNYEFRGDFFQQLIMMLSSGTLSVDSDASTYKLNPKLAHYIEIKQGDTIIPLEELRIQYKPMESLIGDNNMLLFSIYLGVLDQIDKVKAKKKWDAEKNGETREAYIHRLTSVAESTLLELMLKDHSWQDYMAGPGTPAQQHAELEKVISAGGTFYDYVATIDAPESYKEKLINEYENLRIMEECNFPSYPIKGIDNESVARYVNEKEKIISNYKKTHKDWHLNMAPKQEK